MNVTTEAVIHELIDLDEVGRAIYGAWLKPCVPTWENASESVKQFVLRQAEAAAGAVVKQIMAEGDDAGAAP
jgi:hypothetical protein